MTSVRSVRNEWDEHFSYVVEEDIHTVFIKESWISKLALIYKKKDFEIIAYQFYI